MLKRTHRTSPSSVFNKDGWGWFLLATASRAYLIVLLSLAAIAILPALLGWQSSVVQSGSMEPHISAGDVVLSTELSDDAPVPVGGVVEFHSPAAAEPSGSEKIRLHRIVSANDDGTFVTAGDANRDVDSTALTRGQIAGQARLLVPFVGLPSLWIGTGNFGAFAAWAALTLAALFATAWALPWQSRPRHSASESDATTHDSPGESADSSTGDSTASSTDSSSDEQSGAHTEVTRRALLTIAGAMVITGLSVMPRGSAAASFTARTSTVGNSWAVAKLPPLTLGRASSYALLAATSVSSWPPGQTSSVDGSVATSPGTSVTGFRWWDITGSTDRNNSAAQNAKTDALALYSAAGSRTTTATLNPSLTGTISPGVYASSRGEFTVKKKLTLDAQGDPSAIFIFQATKLTAASNSSINLINGASAKNVYWRIAGDVNLERDSVNRGTYMADGDAVMQRDAVLTGRLMSLNGSITLTRADVALPG